MLGTNITSTNDIFHFRRGVLMTPMIDYAKSFRFVELAFAFLVCTSAAGQHARLAVAEDWSRFRGPTGSGVSEGGSVPETFGPQGALWKVDSGQGTSSPILVKQRLFLTSYRDDERILHCLNSTTGETLWTKSYRKNRDEVATPPCGPATPTPAADDSQVYAFFPDVGLVCCSHDGDERWRVAVGPFHSFHGVASSLVVADGHVGLLMDQLQDSFLAAYDCRRGEQVWKIDRGNGPIGGYSTPGTRPTGNGKTEFVVSGPFEVAGYDAGTGKRSWSVEGLTNAPISVPVVSANQFFVCEPSFTENPFKMESMASFDTNKDGKISLDEVKSAIPLHRLVKLVDERWGNGDGELDVVELEKAFASYVGGGGLIAVDLEGSGDTAKTKVRWTYRKSVPHVAAPLLYRSVLYFINDGGILTTMDPLTGEIVKRARLGLGSKYYASPVAADGKVVLLDTEGKLAVLKAQAEWEILTTSALDENCYATPAIANGCVYIRTESKLYCFGKAANERK